MRQSILLFLLVTLVIASLVAMYCDWSRSDSLYRSCYKRIQVGMSMDELEAILGPGTAVNQDNVPSIVVAVNPLDEDLANAKARRSGGSPPTLRDYPTRLKPVVEGDLILEWVNAETGERVLVAFKGGMVCEKHYWNPNYLFKNVMDDRTLASLRLSRKVTRNGSA